MSAYSTTATNDTTYLKLNGGGTISSGNVVLPSGNLNLTTGLFHGNGSGIQYLNYKNITYNALVFSLPLSKSSGNIVTVDIGAFASNST